MITLLLLVRATYVVLFFVHIPFVAIHTFNANKEIATISCF